MPKKINTAQIRVLQDGSKDAYILLTLWFLKRTFIPLILLGVIGGVLAADQNSDTVDFTDPESVASKLLSPLASLAVAFIIKVAVNFAALIAAIPVLEDHYKEIEAGKYGYFFTRYLDRLQVLKGLRSFRWSHHVRQQAASRVRISFIRSGALDRAFDFTNIALIVLLMITIIVIA